MTTAQAARQLHIGERAVRQAVSRGRIPAQRDGRSWRITAAAVTEYRERRTRGRRNA